MRLDKFLKVSRLIKRRTVANEFLIWEEFLLTEILQSLQNRLKKADEIKIEYANRTVTAIVKRVPQNNVSVQEAPSLYEIAE